MTSVSGLRKAMQGGLLSLAMVLLAGNHGAIGSYIQVADAALCVSQGFLAMLAESIAHPIGRHCQMTEVLLHHQ